MDTSGINPSSPTPFQGQEHEEIKNYSEIVSLKIRHKENLGKIKQFVDAKFEDMSAASLNELSLKVNHELTKLTQDTSGIRGFFNWLMRNREYKENIDMLTPINELAKAIRIALAHKAAMPTTGKPSTAPQVETPRSQASEQEGNVAQTISQDSTLMEEGVIPEAPVFGGTAPHAPASMGVVPEAPVIPNEGGIPAAPVIPGEGGIPPAPVLEEGVPPPPPLGNVPLPPATGGGIAPIVKKKPTPEELKAKHEAKEKKRLEEDFNKRANPETYYSATPPEGEKYESLQREQRDLIQDIPTLEESLKSEIDFPGRQGLESMLRQKKTRLETVQSELKGTVLALVNPENSTFASLLKRLTNDELRIIIGMYFKGERPNEGDAKYFLYSPAVMEESAIPKEGDKFKIREMQYLRKNQLAINKNTREALDAVFDNWKVLKDSPIGTAFLARQAQWEKYLEKSRSAFIGTLINRMTGKAQEPVYVAEPYVAPEDKAKGAKVRRPKEQESAQPDRSALIDAIKGGPKLKSAEERVIPEKKKEPTERTFLDDIREGVKLRTPPKPPENTENQ